MATARDALCRVPLDALRAALHRAVRAAWRRKALEPVGLPFGVIIEGRQRGGFPSSATTDAIPIPAGTNEMDQLPTAFASVLRTYRGLFKEGCARGSAAARSESPPLGRGPGSDCALR